MKNQMEDTMGIRIACDLGLRELYPNNGESNEAIETWTKSDTELGGSYPHI